MSDDLTKEQEAIFALAKQGFPARHIAEQLEHSRGWVYDEVRAIRKKGYALTLVSAHEYRRANA